MNVRAARLRLVAAAQREGNFWLTLYCHPEHREGSGDKWRGESPPQRTYTRFFASLRMTLLQ